MTCVIRVTGGIADHDDPSPSTENILRYATQISGKTDLWDALYVDREGYLIILKHSTEIIANLPSLEMLEQICHEYTFQTRGQACLIVDLLAADGLGTYSREASLYKRISENLENRNYTLLIPD